MKRKDPLDGAIKAAAKALRPLKVGEYTGELIPVVQAMPEFEPMRVVAAGVGLDGEERSDFLEYYALDVIEAACKRQGLRLDEGVVEGKEEAGE